jgi:hypothetical protein
MEVVIVSEVEICLTVVSGHKIFVKKHFSADPFNSSIALSLKESTNTKNGDKKFIEIPDPKFYVTVSPDRKGVYEKPHGEKQAQTVDHSDDKMAISIVNQNKISKNEVLTNSPNERDKDHSMNHLPNKRYSERNVSENDHETQEEVFRCDICKKKYSSKGSLQRHFNTPIHMGRNKPRDRKRTFKCYVCNKELKSNYALQRHDWSHTNKRPYRCKLKISKNELLTNSPNDKVKDHSMEHLPNDKVKDHSMEHLPNDKVKEHSMEHLPNDKDKDNSMEH